MHVLPVDIFEVRTSKLLKSTGGNTPVIEARGPLFAGAMRGRGIQSVSLDTKVGCRFQTDLRLQISDLRVDIQQARTPALPAPEVSKSEGLI